MGGPVANYLGGGMHLQTCKHEDIKNTKKAKVEIWQPGFEPSYQCLCECASMRSWSKLQKWYPNYTQVCILAKPGCCLYTVRWGTPHVSPPLGARFLCWHLGYHCHCPPKTRQKFQETGGTVTHALQVLHTLLWTQPSKDDTIRACHTYTHTLLGVAVEQVKGPSGLRAKLRASTALLSGCGLTGMPLRVPLPGLGGEECTAAQCEYVSFMAKSLRIFSSQCLV